VTATVCAVASNNNNDVAMVVAIGLDSTTAAATGCLIGYVDSAGNRQRQIVSTLQPTYPGIGRHTLTWLEYSAATATTTWKGDNGGPTIMQSGIVGLVHG
jgi:hypothetical protein